ncbi:ShlB/FhaC/HecB family hemolysin secretion/activation protein, partial [Acinetobacter bereziniae]|nr:ShlB/FhaC/HecB family hemolysin secretion/activation protein [Acinetobacter bereziniae]
MKSQQHILAASVGACFMLFSNTNHAAPTPNAGQLLQQQQQGQTLEPQPAVQIENTANPIAPTATDVQIPVRKIEIIGNSRFSTQQLHQLVVDAEGQ